MKDKTAEVAGLQILLPAVMILVVTAIGAGFGVQVLGDVRDDMTTDSAEYNATVAGIDGVGNVTSKFGIIGTMIAAMVILGMLAAFLVFRFRS